MFGANIDLIRILDINFRNRNKTIVSKLYLQLLWLFREAIQICNGSSSKHMKTDDSSWNRMGIKWKQYHNYPKV